MFDNALNINWIAAARLFAPLLAILAASAAAILFQSYRRSADSMIDAIIAAAGFAAAIIFAWMLWPELGTVAVGTLTMDRVALAGFMIVSIMAIFTCLMSPAYLAARGESRGGYYTMLSLSAFGMMALICSSELITMLLAIETMSIGLYGLTAFMRERPAALEAALKFFIMGAFATAFFCMGIAFIFGSMGTTSISAIGERAADVASGDGRNVFLFGLAMIVAGLAFKVAAVPFHAWAPDAYDGAPTPVTMFMTTAAKAAAFMAFARLALAVSNGGGVLWHDLAWGIAAATIIWGNLAAIRQQSVKRMLAYSSIANAGYMLTVFPSMNKLPTEMMHALLLFIVAYSISNAGAFAALESIGLAPSEPVDIRHLSGLWRRRPALAAAFALFLLSLAGIPPTLGFFGKYYIFMAVVRAGDAPLVVLALMGSVISVYYYMRPVVAMYFRQDRDAVSSLDHPGAPAFYNAVVAVMALSALTIIIFGILPGNLIAFVEASAF